jgi:hypothetical protein
VETSKEEIAIICKEWDHSAGDRRSSDQSGAKEIDRETHRIDNPDCERKVRRFLMDLSDSYHAGIIMKWMMEKTELKEKANFGW